MSDILIIVPCGRSKVWDKEPERGPIQARIAYTGAPFAVNRQYADHFAAEWLILSAKYGFIQPDFIIPGPYNTTFNDPSTDPVAVASLQGQVRAQNLARFGVIIGLGGKEYRNMVQQAFAPTQSHVVFPFAGLRIGEAMQATKRAIAIGQPFRS